MSYQSVILSDSPKLFWRLDMTGAASNGDSIPDISGNSLNGSLTFSGTIPVQPYGYASPIETDASSREFLCRNDPLVSLSTISRASDSLIEPAGDLSLEAWLRPSGLAMSMVTKRKIFDGICFELRINSNGQFVGSVRDNGGTVWDVTAPGFGGGQEELLQGDSYHVVLVRSVNTLLIYVNGYVRATSTVSSGLPTLAEAGVFRIDAGISGDFEFRADEVAIYTSALSAARVLAHYEAAKAVLPLRATITINVGVELNTDQIIPTNLGFAHNFSETFGDSQIPIVEELSYKTNVNQSEPDYQQRIGARPHGAYRSLEYHLSPNSGAARARLQGSLWLPGQTYCLPIWTDSGVTTAIASSGASTISVDTTKRDYEVGGYVGACTDLQDPATYQFFKITVVADAQLTLASTIGTTIPSGSPIFPARLASISDDSLAVKSYAADHEDSILRFEVLETELSTRRITAYTPATTYKSLEVFSLESAKVSFLDSRPYDIGRRIDARGRDYQYAKDTGSPQTFPVRFLLTTRSQLSDFFGWLDARQGKQFPLWVSSKEKDLICTARPSSVTLTVTKTGFTFHQGRRDVEFLLTDGSYSRLRVTGVTNNGATETWAFADVVPNLVDISRASFLKYCTLAADSVQIRYYRGGSNGAVIADCTLSMRDLLTSPA